MACHECTGKHAPGYGTQIRTTVAAEDSGTITEVAPWTGLPLFGGPELPEDLEFIGGSSEEGKVWRVPVQRILPGGDLNPLRYVISKKTADITFVRGQILPIFVPNAEEPVELAKATSGYTAQALAIAEDPNDTEKIVLQQTGFITFPRTHAYTVGKTYYLSQTVAGEVVSVKPTTGIVQPLFTVIDAVTLAINVVAV